MVVTEWANELRRKSIALRDESTRLKRTADVLGSIADLSDIICEAADTSQCPGCGCPDCPAYVGDGKPGLCVFSRLKNIVHEYYLAQDWIERDGADHED